MITTTYKITPVTKPRMTQKDKWGKRACVVKYWDYKRQIRKKKVHIPECNCHITFILPMPKSWSKKKKNEMSGKPHQQTPDKDNLEKGLLDAIYDQDCYIWDGRVTKRWGYEGKIIVVEDYLK